MLEKMREKWTKAIQPIVLKLGDLDPSILTWTSLLVSIVGFYMLTIAEMKMEINIAKSWIIGDRASDIRAGANAGCIGGIHVKTGHGIRESEQNASLALASEKFKIKILPSIAEALAELPLFKNKLN